MMIDEIIEIEWHFFDQVKNIDGRADCQNHFNVFESYRKAQFLAYNQNVLESYLHDLKEYQDIGLNPIAIKYARMMIETDYNYYLSIKDQLPHVEPGKHDIIETICQLEIHMKEQFEKNYPQISKGMRLNYSMGKQDFVSFENYLKAELSTYSFYTLLLYAQMIVEMMDNNQNIVEIIEQNTVKIFGYDDLLDAEKSINEKL